MKRIVFNLLLLLITTIINLNITMAQISPFDFGLREAADGIERYYALYNAHAEAVANNLTISYDGIDTLDIELPIDFRSIPLTQITDFQNLTLYVTNNISDVALFSLHNSATQIELPKTAIDNENLNDYPELAIGDKLLILDDKNPWTERIGYNYYFYRQDLLWIHNGKKMNNPIFSWNTDSTNLQASFANVTTDQKIFKNLSLIRTEQSKFKTFCLQVNNQFNVLIENIRVETPKSRMIADAIFNIRNSAKVAFRNVVIDGTYSGYGVSRNWGYAFALNNLWNTTFERVEADGNWGVFGTNSMSETKLVDCNINRFDIHCYGRDVLLKNCVLQQRQTQFSSMFGLLRFDSCRFVDCIPVRIRSSYNAYTPFDIEINDCTFELTSRYHSLVNVMLLDTANNPRPELSEKCWPNLKINNLTIIAPGGVRNFNLFHPTGKTSELKKPVNYLTNVIVKGLTIYKPNGKASKINTRLSSKQFITKKELKFTID